MILSYLQTYLKFEESAFVARKGAAERPLLRYGNAADPNETTVAGKPHLLTCPLNPTPIGRLAFPKNKKSGKKAAATGGNPHLYPESSVPNEL